MCYRTVIILMLLRMDPGDSEEQFADLIWSLPLQRSRHSFPFFLSAHLFLFYPLRVEFSELQSHIQKEKKTRKKSAEFQANLELCPLRKLGFPLLSPPHLSHSDMHLWPRLVDEVSK